MSEEIRLNAMDFIAKCGTDFSPDLVLAHLDYMERELPGNPIKSDLLAAMYTQLIEYCRGVGLDEKDIKRLKDLTDRINPFYSGIDHKTKLSDTEKKKTTSDLYQLRARLKEATPEQRNYFRKMFKASPEEVRDDLVRKMGNIECGLTLDYILRKGAETFEALSPEERADFIGGVSGISCNNTLRLIFKYAARHCTNGGRKLFMNLLNVYYPTIQKNPESGPDIANYIHDVVESTKDD